MSNDEHITGIWIQESIWKCSSCQTENKGRDLHCQVCGSDKEKHETDTLTTADPNKAITDADPELLKKATSAPHWICQFCDANQWSFKKQCDKCGAVQDEFKQETQPKQKAQSTHKDEYTHAYKDNDTLLRSLGILGAVSIGVIGIISLFIWLFVSHEQAVVVSAMDWKHTSYLKQRMINHGAGWGGTLVFNAFNVSCERKLKGYEKCHPHNCNPHPERYQCGNHKCNAHSERYICGHHDCRCHNSCRSLRNGFQECSTSCSTCDDYCSQIAYDTCPDYCLRTAYDTCYDKCEVIKDWCRYDYYTWPVVKTETASGSGNKTEWPKLEAIGDEQKLERTSAYEIVFSGNNKVWKLNPTTLNEYERYSIGSKWVIKTNRTGSFEVLHPVN